MIVLVGFMGAGKSAVGRILAASAGLPFVDTDELVETRSSSSIREIFAAGGESAFREIEREVVAEVLSGEDAVVALGGGAVTDPATCAALEWAQVVHLETPFADAMRRIGADPGRPMLEAADPEALYEERRPLYERVADVTVFTADRSPGEIAEELLSVLKRVAYGPVQDTEADSRPLSTGQPGQTRQRSPRPDGQPLSTGQPGQTRQRSPRRSREQRITVPLGERSYEIAVGPGVASLVTESAAGLDAETAFVVTEDAVAPVAQRAAENLTGAGLKVATTRVPGSEEAKSLEVAGRLYDEMASSGVHRGDLVVSVGGGVVCDVAGFAAATYHRGVAVVHVPTTLLAQVDAAIGGKTAINLHHGKNLVGAFHQPRAVLCDVETLATLPTEEIRAGLAEVIKYGFISDPGLLDLVESRLEDILARDPEVLVDVVSRSARIKARIVAADERETGERAHLNYGHTFAHAIEKAEGFGEIGHGAAVALGMMAAAHLAHELGRVGSEVVDRHARALGAAGLPTRAPLDLQALEAAWKHDKKYRRGVKFVLLADVGKAEAGIEAPRDAVAAAIEKMR